MKSPFRLIGALCLLAGSAKALPPSAAVFPVQAHGVDSNSVRIIEDALSNSLMQTGKLRLLERSQMETVLREQGFQSTGTCDGSECAIEVGKILGIQKGVISSLGLLGRTWVLSARLVDIETGEILVSTQRSLTGEIDLALTELVPKVAADLTRTTSPQVSSTTANTPPTPPQAKSGSSTWIWWTLGGVAVAGGAAAAAVLLTSGNGSSPTPAPGPSSESTVPVQVTLP